MSQHEPIITEHKPSIWITPPFTSAAEVARELNERREAAAVVAHEAAEKEMALMRSLNRTSEPTPGAETLELKQPVLPKDFAERVADLDQQIYQRGVAVSRERLESLGKQKFQELLSADRLCREEQRVIGPRTDLTQWFSIHNALSATGTLAMIPVLRRTTHETYAGIEPERDEARAITGFEDLWKLSGVEPRAVRAIYGYRDVFESLVFGQSMLERLSEDGRVRSPSFCGGKLLTLSTFADWLPALEGSHYRVTLTNPLAAIVSWLAGEESPPDVLELARDWSGLRLPSEEQIRAAQAVLDGFLLNYEGWTLWNYVGRRIRWLPDKLGLEPWTEQLRERFCKVVGFHKEVQSGFWRAEGYYRRFDSAAYRRFINQTIKALRDCVASVVALAAAEHSPSTIVARFADWLLLESKTKPKARLGANIQEKLATAFPTAAFKVEVIGP